MNILLVSHGAALGGSPISLLNIAQHSGGSDFRYTFGFATDGPIVNRARQLSDSVHIIPHSRRLFGIATIFRYIKIIIQDDIDLLHLNTFTSYYKYPALAAAITRRKVVWFVRENPEEKRCVKLRNYANRLADKVVTVSYDTAEHMRYINRELLTTIHNGVDANFFSPTEHQSETSITDNKPFILNISSLEQRKGVIDLVTGFAKSKTYLTHSLVILGEDRSTKQHYYNKLLETIHENDLINRVIIVPPKQDVRPYIAGCEFVVLVSYWEGLSRVLLEAIAMGKPILASRNGGNKEVVTDGSNGILVDAGDTDQISSALTTMVQSSELEQMSSASRNIAIDRFSIEKTTNEIESLYKSLQ